jgi:hypothetical protein
MIVLVKQQQATNIVLNAELIGELGKKNKVFNTHSNYKSGKISLCCNGQVLYSPEDFLETGLNEITFVHFSPKKDYVLRATYEEV